MTKIIFACTALALLAACNTFEGMGKDLQGAGQWTTDSAQKVQKKMDNSGNNN